MPAPMGESLASYDIATFEKRESGFAAFLGKNAGALKNTERPRPDWLVRRDRSEALSEMAAAVVPIAAMIGAAAWLCR